MNKYYGKKEKVFYFMHKRCIKLINWKDIYNVSKYFKNKCYSFV